MGEKANTNKLILPLFSILSRLLLSLTGGTSFPFIAVALEYGSLPSTYMYLRQVRIRYACFLRDLMDFKLQL
ncbi:hypothetical protein F5Y00DRAFT_225154, partial [Daldinia vernicosa]|uniref:uncharacterized protein n=1 Tax=Daldinia vernicosa TaxID=114800 RepID=UPI00200777DB